MDAVGVLESAASDGFTGKVRRDDQHDDGLAGSGHEFDGAGRFVMVFDISRHRILDGGFAEDGQLAPTGHGHVIGQCAGANDEFLFAGTILIEQALG